MIYDYGGVFAPLLVSFPAADIPVMQISLKSNRDPRDHIQLRKAPGELRKENILILGSGFSYHNLRTIPDHSGVSQIFYQWLYDSLCQSQPQDRVLKLENLSAAPAARSADPREEHLIPLMVCAGASENGMCQRVFSENLPGWNN